jgi:acyl-CoA hydrolase
MLKDENYITAEEALASVKSGDRVFVQGSAQTPTFLLSALAKQKDRLTDVELTSITLQGDVEPAKAEYAGHFRTNSLFVSAPVRDAVNCGLGDFVPVFLSDIPHLFRGGILPLDVALVQVSPPDKHGYCSLGVSVDIALTAVLTAKIVIAQVNPRVPRTHGDGIVHVSKFSHLVYQETPLTEVNYGARVSDAEKQIGRYVAEMIEDGSCLQLGIGTIPDAVLQCLEITRTLASTRKCFLTGCCRYLKRAWLPTAINGSIQT